eukprot:6644818-Pyramimonas_sp.AAC.1
MEVALVAGRWASSMTARIYVEGAVADLVKVRFQGQAASTSQHGLALLQNSKGQAFAIKAGGDSQTAFSFGHFRSQGGRL